MSEVKVLSPAEAWEILQKNPNAVMIDIRSSMEYLFVGHPKGAINIPWIDEPDWRPDPLFASQVRQVMLGGSQGDPTEENPPLTVLICRSGRRSLEAGEKLTDDGMKNVYHVQGGFEGPLDEEHHRSSVSGWRFDGLPWEQC